MRTEIAIFGAGCFWKPEEVFSKTPGVLRTQVGYIGGKIPNPNYPLVCSGVSGHVEATKIIYDPRKISYGTVAKILHRSEKQVYAYLNSFTPLKISQTIQEKQSRGAQWLGEMIEKKFHSYKIVREHILYQKNTRHIKGCHYNYPAVRLDYYLPQLHIGFEYDGPQHDRFVEFFHKDAKGFRRSQIRDKNKSAWCVKKGIELIRFSWKNRLTEGLFNRKIDKVLEKKIGSQ